MSDKYLTENSDSFSHLHSGDTWPTMVLIFKSQLLSIAHADIAFLHEGKKAADGHRNGADKKNSKCLDSRDWTAKTEVFSFNRYCAN